MSSQDELSYRLLNMLPATVLKKALPSVHKNKNDIITEWIANRTPQQIKDAAFESFGFFHQRAYLYDLVGHTGPAIKAPLTYTAGAVTAVHNTANCVSHRFEFLQSIQVAYYNRNTKTEGQVTLEFIWPVVVDILGNYMAVRTAILEKDIRAYLPVMSIVTDSVTQLHEPNILASVIAALPQNAVSTKCNFDKGIKALWAKNGIIDTLYINHRDTDGTVRRTQDTGRYVKRYRKSVYQKVIAQPLFETLFDKLREKDEYPRRFVVNPQDGIVETHQHADSEACMRNLINEIVAHN